MLKFLKAVDHVALSKGQGQKYILSVVVSYKYLSITSLRPDRMLGPSFRFPSLLADELLLTLLGRRERNKAAFVKEYPELSSLVEAGVSGLIVGHPIPKRYWHTDPLPMESMYNTRARMAPTFINSIDKPAYKDLMICFYTDYGSME